MAVVIADAGPLIALAKISHLHLLGDLFTTVLVTSAVVEECICLQTDDATLIAKALESGLLKRVDTPMFKNNLSKSLGIGEQSSIEYALQLQENSLLIVDDALARKQAIRNKLAVVGTAAILFMAEKRKLVDDVESLIEQLTQKGYRISPNVVAQLKALSL